MENIVCKSCGGSVTRKGNYYICDFCRSKWMIDSGNDVHAVERANAWEALRNNDFEKAAELFENIIVKDSSNHEAFWGRALALNGIVYVTDYNENKKVPTCNNITEESFLKNKDVQKAISLAPTDIKESYQTQAEQIEKIRKEWLNKASKEPAYDIFISFKDSDREHGVERTQDSIDVQDLYTALVQKGYNVFFSRVTLRDKVSEQYEPYIYNALKTAKVMIVFGEKTEYFNAVWVKNEWSRFKTRLEKGEKHKNSLITVYKNVNPYEIPIALTGGRQAIDYSIPSNYEVLMNHIKRVIEESEQAVHLDRIEIKGGQMAKKSSKIKTETLQTRELGKGAIAKTSISEKQTLDIAHSYLMGRQWEDANKLLDDLLFNNPNLAESIWYKLQAKFQVTSDDELFKKISSFVQEDYDTIARILNCAEKELATHILNSMYGLCKNVSENTNFVILNTVLPFNYDEREEKIAQAFADSISSQRLTVFKLLLSTLDSNDVDTYIKYNLEFAKIAKNIETKEECLNNVVSVDVGNLDALKMFLILYLDRDDVKNTIKTLETILKYSSNHKKVVYDLLVQTKNALNSNEDCLVLRELLKYYPGELVEIKDLLLDVAFIMIQQGYFDHAKYLLSLALTVDDSNKKIYWGLCLVKTKAKSENGIIKSDILLKGIPEYTKYLTMVDENRRQECFKLAKQQEHRKEAKKSAKKAKIVSLIIAAIISAVVAVVVTVQNVIIPANQFNIKYNLNGGVATNPSTYSAFDDGFELAVPTKEGYTFIGWTSESNSSPTKTISIEKGTKGDKEFTANWQANTYTITYDANGGVASATSQDVTFDENFELPSVEERDYYVFEGWYNGEKKIKNGVWKTEGNVTLVARWNPISYKISYKLSGGKTINPTTYTIESEFALSNPTRDGYTFIGWTGEGFDTPTQNVVIQKGGYGARKYTAHWIPTVYNISYDLGYGAVAINPTSYTIEQSVTIIAPTRDGYNFIGWIGTGLDEPVMTITIPVGKYGDCKYVAQWEEWTMASKFDYLETEGGVSITAYKGEGKKVVIPEKIDGKNVISLADSAFKNSYVTTVVLPRTLTTIGDNTFYNCDSLTSVVIPDCVTSIGNYSFYDCNKITSITIPSSLKTIGSSAFLGCNYLEKLQIEKGVTSIGSSAFKNCYRLTNITLPDSVTSIGSYAFDSCWNATDVTLPHSVTSIGTGAFYRCSDFKKVNYTGTIDEWVQINFANDEANPLYYAENLYINGVLVTKVVLTTATKVSDYAFNNCTSIKSVEIGNGVISIGKHAFDSCIGLTKVEIAYSVTSIGEYAFYNCSNLKIYCEVQSEPSGWSSSWNYSNCPVYWDYNTVKTHSEYDYIVIGESARLVKYKGGNTNVVIPSEIDGHTVTSLLDVFKGNTKITSIEIPNSVTSIGSSAFYGCTSLTSMAIPDSLTSINEKTFYNCTSLASIVIPDSVTSIGSSAFYGCTSLASIVIPDSVTSIGSSAFYGCTSLTSIAIPDSLTSINEKTFYNCTSLASIVIPDSVTSIGSSAFFGCKFEKISAPMLILSEISKTNLKEVIITSGSSIYSNEFKDCSNLTKLTIGNSVTGIGEYAFYGCTALTSVTIPDSVTSIGKEAFRHCTSLKSVSIGNGVESISYGMLYNCYSLTSVTIGNSVTSIGSFAFDNCLKLASLKISKKVTDISNYAFNDCDELTIYTEWKSKPSGWGESWNKTLYNYSDYIPVVWGYTYE